jgi:polyadenylate-binding protein
MMSIQQPAQQQPQSMLVQQGGNMNATPFHSASLYVGDLVPDITETSLYEIFNQVGPVASIRVCRDTITRRSLGYSYVNFHNVADAERALDTMNFSLIRGNPCRIMWSQRDPSMRRSGVGNAFVKNLDESVDNKALYDTFSLFGNILSCKVATDENSLSKGYGYVHYETAESANEAIARIDGMMIAGKQVHVGHFVRRNERPSQTEWTNIYVKNIPLNWDEERLRSEFGKFGEITSIKIQSESSENGILSKGFGFINFDDHEAADLAVAEMNGKMIADVNDDLLNSPDDASHKLFCCRAQKRTERMRELQQKFDALKNERMNKYLGVNLYVKNLDESIDEDILKEAFASYGNITSVHIMKDPLTGESKGFGFVCFSSPDKAAKAVQEMNNKIMVSKPIYVALAQRKEVRRAQLEAQYSRGAVGPRGPVNPIQGNMYGMGMPYMMAGQPSPFQQPQQPPRSANSYPMTPQMMPRGPPRENPMQSFPTHNAYPMPAYSMGAMSVQQPRRVATNTGNISRSRMIPPGSSNQPGFQSGLVSGAGVLNGGLGRAPPGNGVAMMHQRGGVMHSQGPPRNAPYGSQGGQPQGNFKYMQQVRNPSSQQQVNMMGGMMMSAQHAESLTAQALAAASPETQKNMIGERLYPLIYEIQPDLAGKITGMLLEMDNGELLHLLESPDSLKAKIHEAMLVLEAHGTD